MATPESVTLFADIQMNLNYSEFAFIIKLARPLNLPGQWGVSIMELSYPYQWTTIHRDLTYAVKFPMINAVSEYDHRSILHRKQPIRSGHKFGEYRETRANAAVASESVRWH